MDHYLGNYSCLSKLEVYTVLKINKTFYSSLDLCVVRLGWVQRDQIGFW